MASSTLFTVTGKDHPDAVTRLTGIVAGLGAALLELEQVVIQGRLIVAMRVDLAPESNAVERLRAETDALGLSLEVAPVSPAGASAAGCARHVVTVIGPSIGAAELHQVSQVLTQHGARLQRISRLSSGRLHALELHVGLRVGESAKPLQRALGVLSTAAGFDVALQPESLFRRAKRLVVMDMDSTLIRIEVIDELARAAGVTDQVAAITHRAMLGEMDYDASLRQRLALLKGLDVSVLERIAANLPLTEGAETLARVLKRLGYRLAVLSGGFSIAAEALKARLGLDEAFSNRLEIEGGKLTGNVVGPIVNGRRKAELLETIARKEGIPLEQVIAVGDGANDLQMLERAGLGIAFRAKPKLREAADLSITASGLDAILFLLGISAEEIAEVSRD